VIPAGEFIGAVETSELGRKLDCLSLEIGLRTLQEQPSLRLSINMSARSIGYPPWMAHDQCRNRLRRPHRRRQLQRLVRQHPAHDLGAAVLEALVERAGIDKSDVSETILGQVLTAARARTPPARRISTPACRRKARPGASTRSAARACAPWRSAPSTSSWAMPTSSPPAARKTCR
jgi:hypothetical protein